LLELLLATIGKANVSLTNKKKMMMMNKLSFMCALKHYTFYRESVELYEKTTKTI